MILIMLGAPGTGKGTVASKLSEKLGIPQVSTGDIFRKAIAEKTPVGIEAEKYISQGMLVPDETTIRIVEERLKDADVQNGLILDGFPRTVNQARVLDEMLTKEGKKIDIVVNLETPEEEILERIVNRRICSNSECKTIYNTVLNPSKVDGVCDKCGAALYQRDDDKLEKAKNRLEVYHRETAPVADYYKETGALYSTVLSQAVNRMKNEVAADVIEYLKNK